MRRKVAAVVLVALFSVHNVFSYHTLSPLKNRVPISVRVERNKLRYKSIARHHPRSSRWYAPALSLSPSSSTLISKSTLLAVTTLLGTSTVGFLSDVLVWKSGGILVTLVLAAVLSNLGLAPSSHWLYESCWTTFLPASLALLLLLRNNEMTSSQEKDTVVDEIRTVSVPFWIGSLGSILGCIVSFLSCLRFPFGLSRTNASLAAGCLCASYIGGSVNFFAAANILSKRQECNVLLSSMAAADLIVMAAYFLFLTATVESKALKRCFSVTNSDIQEESKITRDVIDDGVLEANTVKEKDSILHRASAVPVAGLLALVIVDIARRFEAMVAPIVPGTACAVISVLCVWIQRVVPRNNALWRRVQRVAAPMSDLSFHLLFAAIGTSANLVQALKYGPACLGFSLLALLVRVVVVFAGSMLANQLGLWRMQLKHVLVASNAAIGGPATAAAFAGRFRNEKQQQGLVLAATTWGVVGYAVGTAIGVTLTRLLQRIVS